MIKRSKFLTILLLFILSSFVHVYAHPLKKVSLQLMWLDQFEFAGFYIAKEKGFYEDVGLDLDIKKFTKNTNVLDTVLQNEAQFGISSSSLMVEYSKGKDILLLGSIFQSSPLVLLALKDSNIKTIEDIKNKKLMITKEEMFYVTLQTMLKSKNIKISDLNILKPSFNIDDLINKKTDLILAYSTNEPYLLQEKGYESKIFNPKDYGFDFYEDFIFTTSKFEKENPKVVNDFYAASMRGWKYAFDNVDETIKLIKEKYNFQNKSINSLKYEAKQIKELALVKNTEFGSITKEKLKLIETSYKIMGLLNKDLNLDKLVHKNLSQTTLLSANERHYLEHKQSLNYCINPDWFPLESIKNGKHIGMSSDLIEEIQSKLNISINLVPTANWSQSIKNIQNKTCDFLPLANNIPSKRNFLHFSQTFFSFPVVIATKMNQPYISNIRNIIKNKLAVAKGSSLIKTLKHKYPHIDLLEVESVEDGLDKVKSEEVYGFVDSMVTIGYKIQNKFSSELKISAQFDLKYSMSIASRNDEPLLHSILQKTLNTIDEKTKQNIISDWTYLKVEKSIDYTLLWIILAIVLLIFIAFSYKNYILNKSKKILEQTVQDKTKELKRVNDSLEKTVKQRTEELEDSNEVFQHMLHTTMEAIFILEYNFCVDANKEAIRLFKFKNNEDIMGTFIFDFIVKDSHEFLQSDEDLSLNKPYEVKAVKNDGTIFPALIKLQTLKTRNRTIKVLTLLDLTQLKEQELKLITQSKMVSLGELIGNIAHHWRQPLAAISSSASGMKMQKELDILSDEELITNCDDIVNSSTYLSETINEFKHLIKGDKRKKEFKLKETLIHSISLLKGILETNSIEIIQVLDENIIINGYRNELTQVIINVVKNAKDAFLEKDIKENRLIFIKTKLENDKILIDIKDNAGGVPVDHLDRIFEPYFSTKHKSQDTGLGLYMSHQIITSSFEGSIVLRNEKYIYKDKTFSGAKLTITIPK